MFTGIVEALGEVSRIEDRPGFRKIWLRGPEWLGKYPSGGSLAINGCCTTNVCEHEFACDLMKITLEKTSLGLLDLGAKVNLERPMALGEELGGHLVQGHVDGTGNVVSIQTIGDTRLVEISIPESLRRYVILTGSIAIDGVSLTVAELRADSVVIGIIPHTWEVTVFQDYFVGRRVNIEVDMIGKYIERLLPEKFLKGELREMSGQ
ncbi:MAG: riboflavin synthase [Calditrichaeota bacterium]|nr:riboflavin synthase [Calditrichota bacterium]MCB9391124.1 riboflavin synthase [Calditrichota bacterium]